MFKTTGKILDTKPRNGILQLDRHIIEEKFRTGIFKHKVERYLIDTKHIKNNFKGKPFIVIDLNTHKSIGLDGEKVDGEMLNTLDFLVDKEYHKANMEVPKLTRWEKISYMFVGIGVIALIVIMILVIRGGSVSF